MQVRFACGLYDGSEWTEWESVDIKLMLLFKRNKVVREQKSDES